MKAFFIPIAALPSFPKRGVDRRQAAPISGNPDVRAVSALASYSASTFAAGSFCGSPAAASPLGDNQVSLTATGSACCDRPPLAL